MYKMVSNAEFILNLINAMNSHHSEKFGYFKNKIVSCTIKCSVITDQ